jgi:16S rRNA (cytidine1402-2'-O)-methyltransferase
VSIQAGGTLYVVATPIGNLDDISHRALQVLERADRVAAEDTRRTRRLLTHFGIRQTLVALHDHNESVQVPALLAGLQRGETVALVSDAGTPLISDPGFRLVRGARQAGVEVSPVPGASSVIAALCAAGLPADRFAFEGFLPARSKARQARIAALAAESRTLVFLESCHRVADTIGDLHAAFGGEREAAVARELTKIHEEFRLDTLSGLHDWIATCPEACRGEFVIVVHGAPEDRPDVADPKVRRVLSILLDELPVARAASLAARITGCSRKALYAAALDKL